MSGSPLFRRVATVIVGTALVGAGSVPASASAPAKPVGRIFSARADDGAQVTKERWLSEREFDLTIASPALGTSVKVRVLVPKAWNGDYGRWPVVYAFHGGRDHYTGWTRETDIERLSAKWNVMVVMPEGGRNGSYTDWYNYGEYGVPQWEKFHLFEVREIMERGYHAGYRRAVMGISSGGQGAITYAARYPGMFRYAASFSGPLSIRMPGVPALLMLTIMGSGDGTDPFRVWGVPRVDEFNWRQHDPYYLLPRLRGTGLYVSSGTTGKPGPKDDPDKALWDIGLLSERVVGATDVAFVNEAEKLGIPVTTHIYGNGSHSWKYWKREVRLAWPRIMRGIKATKAQQGVLRWWDLPDRPDARDWGTPGSPARRSSSPSPSASSSASPSPSASSGSPSPSPTVTPTSDVGSDERR